MSTEHLRVAAFCVYLAAWIVVFVAAGVGAIARRYRQAAAQVHITVPVVVGTLLQAGGALAITLSMGSEPLRPKMFEMLGTLVLAPLGAALFVWALASVPKKSVEDGLVTTGAYAWLRHPMYLAFLALLAATGFVTSAGLRIVGAVALYLAGSELRIASEEAELAENYPATYAKYRMRTRWRYLPGLR